MTTPESGCGEFIDGGAPDSVLPDILDGGAPDSVFPDIVDGAGVLGLCHTDTLGEYLGVLGDGGDGHTIVVVDKNGTPVLDIGCRDISSLKWTRELSQVSQLVITAGPLEDDVVANVDPWVHRVDVYRDGEHVWSGPVLDVDSDGDESTIIAVDPASFASRTRTQVTKSWVATDPALIAAEIFATVYQWHGVPGDPAVFASSVAYDYTSTKDAQRADQAISDLVKLGADWTIFRGRPVTMATVRTAELVSPTILADCHFAARLRVRKAGSRLMTDVMVKGKNYSHTSTNTVGGLRLQAIVNLNDLFGAANIRRAADQLAQRRSANQLQVIVPGGATLSPDTPVGINELMPGVIFPIYTSLAGGVMVERKLEKLEVTVDASGERVAATFGPVPGSIDADADSPGI